MTRFNRLNIFSVAALGVMATVVPLAAGSASASTGAGAMTHVPPGISAAALPGAVKTGTTPPSTKETVSFVLTEQHKAALSSAVEHGLHSYLSVRQFASIYGQTPAHIGALQSYLAGFHIRTTVDADNVDVVARGTVGDFNRALGVTQSQYHVPEITSHDGMMAIPAQNVHGTATQPWLPSGIARYVTAILGLTNYGPYGSQSVHVSDSVAKPRPASSNPCLKLTGLPDACNTVGNFASDYGLDSLYNQGYEGAGQTVAIVTLAALDRGAPSYYWSHIAHVPATGRTVTVDNVDGGPGAPSDASGTGETDIDVEQAGGLAPASNVVVYQAPNTDYGFADAFFAAASQNIASSVSASWLESETFLQASIVSGVESPGYEAAFDEAFLEMAAQGQSGFIASGDWAAYTATVDLGTTNLSVGASADSPYITAAGGTTLPWTGKLTGPEGSARINVTQQRTWGWDYLWKPVSKISGEPLADSAESQVIGSGGGFSTIEKRPSYQFGVPGVSHFHAIEYLTPTDPQTVGGITEPTQWIFNPAPSVTQGNGAGRAMPDLSTDADPYTGYLRYEPSARAVGQPALQGGWGGTSFVGPQLNGSTAVIDSFVGHRVGLWNPSIYAFAQWSSSPFTPLQSNGPGSDNLYYTGNPGQLFNQGSGLGVPNLGALAEDWAMPAGSRG
jgi:subtilase family serine protease